MYVTNPFKHFDPKKGEGPTVFADKFEQIIFRARRVLGKRSTAEIRAAWRALQWLSDDKTFHEPIWDELRRRAAALDEGAPDPVPDPVSFSNASLMLAARDKVDIRSYSKFRNGTWPEYFAVLALALVGIALDDEKDKKLRFPHADQDDLRERFQFQFLGYWAIEGMEAITMAESILREDQTKAALPVQAKTHAKAIISFERKKAAIARHAKTNELKADFCSYRQDHPNLSTAEAARRFLKSQPMERRRILRESNAVRTLAEAWTVHSRQRSPSAPPQ